MKNFKTLLFTAILTMLLIIPVSAANQQLGDINADTEVNASDARLALRFASKIETPTENEKLAADVDKDEKITAADARIILRVAAKLETLPEEEKIPEQLQILFDGEYQLIDKNTDEYGNEYTFAVSVSGDNALYSFAYYGDDAYSSEILMSDNGHFYEVQTNMLIATSLDEYFESGLITDDAYTLSKLVEIKNEKPDFTVTTDYSDSNEYTVYTFLFEDGSLKVFMLDEKISYIITYDTEMFMRTHIAVNEVSTEFDGTVLDINNYTIMSEEEYYEELFGDYDDFYDDDYFSDEYWADTVDWDGIPVVTVTDESEAPEEYKLLCSDNYYLFGEARTPATEDSLLATDGYLYANNEMTKYGDSVLISYDDAGLGFSELLRAETGDDGKSEIVLYLLNSNRMEYALFDEILQFSMGLSIEDMGIESIDDMKLIEEFPDKLEIQETEIDGVVYKKLAFTYEADNYVAVCCFADGKLIRLEDYENGENVAVMLVSDFTTQVDPATVSLDNYTEVGSMEFIMNMFDFEI